jgi:hypothetical protein
MTWTLVSIHEKRASLDDNDITMDLLERSRRALG